MLRSRMLPDGFKLFFGICCYALFGALILGVGSVLRTTDGKTVSENLDTQGVIATVTGPLSIGWKGAVGNHLGYTVLFVTAIAAGFLAFLLVAFRDADPEAEAAVLEVDSVPLTKAPAGANYSPFLGAIAVVLIAGGWVKSTNVMYAGLILLALVLGAWTIRAWAERATGDDEVNAQLYRRIIDPVRVPILAVLMIGYIVVGISRVFLAVPSSDVSTAVFLVFGLGLFLAVVAVGVAGNVSKVVIGILLAVFAALVLGFGIYGIVKGDRPTEPHGGETSGHTEGGLGPVGVGTGG